MIEAKDLRIGNYVQGKPMAVPRLGFYSEGITKVQSLGIHLIDTKQWIVEPIILTEDILIKAGFEKIPYFTVTNSIVYDLGRNRILLVGAVETGNEMIWLCEIDKSGQHPLIKDLVCIRNYDYDGKTYFHTIQNIVFDLSGKELSLNL